LIGKTYHDYIASPYFLKPDLIVAFNTGMYEVDKESWMTSLEAMLELNVPALFTSFCKHEADEDISVLRSANANLNTPNPMLNPFKSAIPMIDSSGVDKFYHANMYYMAFQGRS
jgi:hypothetical protein